MESQDKVHVMHRREVREAVFKLLFISQFNSVEEMPEQLQLYFAEGGICNEDMGDGRIATKDDEDLIGERYRNVCARISEIDSLLSDISTGWKVSRMNKVDLSVLRLAVYEVLFDEEIPVKVAINEAVELSKKYGGEDSQSFVNGILGKLVRQKDMMP